MRITGLDLSLTATGLCAEGHRATIETNPDHFDKADATDRIRCIVEQARQVWRSAITELVILEDLLNHSVGGQAFDRAGLAFCVRSALVDDGIPYVLVNPTSVKIYATGRGTKVSKSDVRMAIYKRWGLDIADDNQADAFVLREIGRDHYLGENHDLPQTHRRALDKIAWPEEA